MAVLVNLIVVCASLLGAGMALPQARRVVTTRRVDGLSPMWAGVSVALNAWWLAYGVFAGIWALIPVSAASLVLYAAICWALVRELAARAARGILIGGLGLALVPLPFLVLGGWPLAGIAIGSCYGLQLLPAVVAAHRSRNLSGIAPGTWLMAFAEAVLWLAYSAVIADPALAVGGVAGVVMSSAILVRLAVTGHRPLGLIDARRRLAFAR